MTGSNVINVLKGGGEGYWGLFLPGAKAFLFNGGGVLGAVPPRSQSFSVKGGWGLGGCSSQEPKLFC